MTNLRLGSSTLDLLPASIRRFGYDRSTLRPGIMHLGAGAFHRCHQAEWTDDALEAEFGDWGIVAVNLRAPDLGGLMGAQDGLFCRELRDSGSLDRRVIGAIIDTVSVPEGDDAVRAAMLERALAVASAATTRVITMTVTEKGYCHVPATGQLNPEHPDIVHDVAHPESPRSVPGCILRALALRIDRGVPFPTILSCDNVPDNGATLRRCVVGLARFIDPALATLVERYGIFLNTMVDRIVPATRDVDLERFERETGVRDAALVVGEPFRMWVIENPVGAELPPWDKAGAMVVNDVVPFELMKMRILNGIQTNVSALGLIDGLEFMSDVMGSEVYRSFARRTIMHEVLPSLPPVPGIDLAAYVEQSIARLRNTELRHSTVQIVTDASQKIRQRLLEPLRFCLKSGLTAEGLLIGVAAWLQAASGVDLKGGPLSAPDPIVAEARAIGRQAGRDAQTLVRGMLSIGAVFGDDLRQDQRVEAGLVRQLTDLRQRGVAPVLASAAR